MKNVNLFSVIMASGLLLASAQAFAGRLADGDLLTLRGKPALVERPEIISATGVVQCRGGAHPMNEETCDLEFISAESGKRFDIVDSPALVSAHCGRETNLRVTLEAEKTSSFLFWGGDLKVRKFEIMGALTRGTVSSNESGTVAARAHAYGRNAI